MTSFLASARQNNKRRPQDDSPTGRNQSYTAVMVRRWLWMALRSLAAGWAVLIALTYLAERPLLVGLAPLVGPRWVSTASLTLDCLKLAATGWVIGRLHRKNVPAAILIFALSLCLFSFEEWTPLDVQGLVRLATDAFLDSRYWLPLATLATQHALLFGSFLAGGLLSRPAQKPLSLFGEVQKD